MKTTERSGSAHFIEAGEAFRRLEAGEAFRRLESAEAFRRLGDGALGPVERERFDAIVIGGGQAGLSVGYHLRRRGVRFVILDAAVRVGDAWRQRWDSLRLFTPAKFDGLPGFRFPAPANSFPTKDEMADYLEAYVARFELPVRSGTRVERLFRRDGVFVVQAGQRQLEANQVIVAMSSFQEHRTPAFARALDPDIVQLHAGSYRGPEQLRDGPVLVVGAGNSGAEIALELVRGRETWMAGRDPGEIPFRIDGVASRVLTTRLVLRFVFHRLLTVRTPVGRKARAKLTSQGGARIRVKGAALAASGVKWVSRVTDVRDGRPVLDDGRVLDVANIVWCTGFQPGFSWIDLPAFDEAGAPLHEAGVVDQVPGLYFVGLHFLFAMSSTMIHGVGRDAARIAAAVARRAAAETPRASAVRTTPSQL